MVDGGIMVNKSLTDSRFKGQKEICFVDGMAPVYIRSAQLYEISLNKKYTKRKIYKQVQVKDKVMRNVNFNKWKSFKIWRPLQLPEWTVDVDAGNVDEQPEGEGQLLDLSQSTPTQELIAKDLHGKVDGQPKGGRQQLSGLRKRGSEVNLKLLTVLFLDGRDGRAFGGPSFIEKALQFLEEFGTKVEGIVQQSADVEEVDRRVQEYKQGKAEFDPEEDAHVAGNCVKHVLRELPSSPVPASYCTALLEAYKIDRKEARINAMRSAILETFPEPNRRLSQTILKMMHTISSHTHGNRMTPSVVAACTAPLLLRPPLAGECELEDDFDVSGDNSAQLLAAANAANNAQAIITTPLEEYENIFDVLLTGFRSLPPLFEDTPNAIQELTIARDIYEHAAVLSVKIEDQDAFERDFFQLKPYYTDAGSRLPPSPHEYPILGLNLLRLLVQSRIAEFHTELELLLSTALENPCIKHAVELEQSFMEGACNHVLGARQTAPHETYVYFMDLLAKTVRDEIAGCSEKAYDYLSITDAHHMSLFYSDQERLEHVKEHVKEEHPEWEIKNGSVFFQKAKETAPCKEIP